MIDTLLAVGFAAATLAALSSDDGDEEQADEGSSTFSTVSTLGVGMATTAAFVASAAHGHKSIQTCLAQRQDRAAADQRHAEAKLPRAPGRITTLSPQATYAASALVAPR